MPGRWPWNDMKFFLFFSIIILLFVIVQVTDVR
jgi:hypothetical protein